MVAGIMYLWVGVYCLLIKHEQMKKKKLYCIKIEILYKLKGLLSKDFSIVKK